MTLRSAAAERTVDKIVEATRYLFAERAIAEITLADIAERSGVTVQTILRRFGDKSAVFAETITRFSVEVMAQRDQAVANDLDDLVRNLCEHYEMHGRFMVKVLGEEASTPSLGAALDIGRDYHRRWCETGFGATLARLRGAERGRRLAQLIAICDLRTWEVLRLRCGLSRTQTQLAVREMLQPLMLQER